MADNIWNLGNVPGNRPDDVIAQDVIIEIDRSEEHTSELQSH